MSTHAASEPVLRFDGWEIRPESRTLIVNGTAADLRGRAFDVLLALVERRGRLVTTDEIHAAVWRGQVVENNNVSVQVSHVRDALPGGVITTIRGRGYQLIAVPIPALTTPVQIGAGALEPPQDRGLAPVPARAVARDDGPGLLGRDREWAELYDWMNSDRLITIVGPGGVGKTTLARAAFGRRRELAQLPCLWVDLAPVREARQLLVALGKQLGVELHEALDPHESLLAALSASGESLVVLDNCEHLLDPLSAFVAAALQAAPCVSWLATSQEPLRVNGQRIFWLKPLAVPESDVSPAQAMEYGAVALLCDRLARSSGFRLDEDNVASVIQLCSQLDGLPLAIEMVVPRVASLNLKDVSKLLAQRFKLLTDRARSGDSRHGTLQGVYDRSHDRLDEVQRTVFRRLEPFLGGFTSDMAQAVACDDEPAGRIEPVDVALALNELVDKSLIQKMPGREARFVLLESARDYARAQLRAAGEEARLRSRYAQAVAQAVTDAASDACEMTDARWLERYAPERHNLRAALERSVADGAADDVARIVTALAMIDWIECRKAEVVHYVAPLQLLGRLERATPRLRVQALLEVGWAVFSDGDQELSVRLGRQCVDIAKALKDRALEYRALKQLSRILERQPGMDDESLALAEKAKGLLDSSVPRRILLFCAISMERYPSGGGMMICDRLEALRREADGSGFNGIAAIGACNVTDQLLVDECYADVVSRADQYLHLYPDAKRACTFILYNKTVALVWLNRFEEACESAMRALRMMPDTAHFLVAAIALGHARLGNFQDAAVLHGCAVEARRKVHRQGDPSEVAVNEEIEVLLRAALPVESLREFMLLGAALTPHSALVIKGRPPAATRRPTRDAGAEALPGPVSSGDLTTAN